MESNNENLKDSVISDFRPLDDKETKNAVSDLVTYPKIMRHINDNYNGKYYAGLIFLHGVDSIFVKFICPTSSKNDTENDITNYVRNCNSKLPIAIVQEGCFIRCDKDTRQYTKNNIKITSKNDMKLEKFEDVVEENESLYGHELLDKFNKDDDIDDMTKYIENKIKIIETLQHIKQSEEKINLLNEKCSLLKQIIIQDEDKYDNWYEIYELKLGKTGQASKYTKEELDSLISNIKESKEPNPSKILISITNRLNKLAKSHLPPLI